MKRTLSLCMALLMMVPSCSPYRSRRVPQKKGGNVVLDLNGYSIDITAPMMTSLFAISRLTDFYVINSKKQGKPLRFTPLLLFG